jgi:hypothetical protein
MRASSIGLFALVPGGIFGQNVFEPADFNVTEALLRNGVNVSEIPDLAGSTKRSFPSSCSIAVSAYHKCDCRDPLLHKAYL